MWAMGQSARGSGMSTVLPGERSFALSAMKRTPANTSVAQSSVAGSRYAWEVLRQALDAGLPHGLADRSGIADLVGLAADAALAVGARGQMSKQQWSDVAKRIYEVSGIKIDDSVKYK